MKKGIVLVTAMILFSTGMACAEVAIDADATWVSKYIWRGFDILDDRAAFQPSVNFDFGNGLSFNAWSSHAGSGRDTVNAEEWRYMLTYGNSTFDGQAYAMDYAISWIYYDYPDMASNDADMQEFNVAFSWPDLCPMGVVPSYTYIYMWSAEGNGLAAPTGGPIHVFGLNYDLAVAELPNPLSLGVAAVYNDGTGTSVDSDHPNGVDHDWSHILWGVSTSFDCGPGTLSPGVYYQTSMDDSVNPEDEFWCGISYGVSF